MNEASNMTPFDKAFAQNLAIRACQYNPTENFESVTDEFGTRKILALPYKLLWFHTYCAEKGIEGYVESDDFSITAYESSGTAIVTARARVIMNGKVVATGSAGKSFILNNSNMMDGAVQAATGSALSRALGNAGFGTISSNELNGSAPVVPDPNQQNAPLPYTFSAGNNCTAPTNCNNPGTSSGPSAPDQSSSSPAPAPDQQSFLPQPDPIAAAKAVICPCGPKKGMPYGEVLAIAPSQIIWIAENWKKTGPELDAAKALLDEAKKKCGK